MKFNIVKLLATATLLIDSSVHAWWDRGHLFVATIAYDILKKESPKTLEKMDAIFKPLKDSNPTETSWEDKYTMVECATFADYKY